VPPSCETLGRILLAIQPVKVSHGQLELRAGQHAEVLAKGDSASFAGDLPHEYVNTGSAVTRFALTVFEPAVGGGAAR
jgi:quercetin dioxygenase-like cupin family protein